jgi:hypothetical protein
MLSGIITEVKYEHDWNAEFPIEVTVYVLPLKFTLLSISKLGENWRSLVNPTTVAVALTE